MNARTNALLLTLGIGGIILYNFVPKRNPVNVEDFSPWAPEPQWSIPEKGLKYQYFFSVSEQKYGLPDNILARMAYQESRFRDDVITGELKSSAGAVGIMQIIPRWHPYAKPEIPELAIDYAGKFLRRLYDKFGTWPLALAGYNWGEGNVMKWLNHQKELPTETKNYMNDIMNDIGLV